MRDETSDKSMASVESTADRIERWRAVAHHYGLHARDQIDNEEYELAGAAASMAAMYFAMALDAHHFGRMPKPEIRRSPNWLARDVPIASLQTGRQIRLGGGPIAVSATGTPPLDRRVVPQVEVAH